MSYRCTGFSWCGEYIERGLRCDKCEAQERKTMETILGSVKEKTPPREDVGHAPLSLGDAGRKTVRPSIQGRESMYSEDGTKQHTFGLSGDTKVVQPANLLSNDHPSPLSLAGECPDSDELWQAGKIAEWKQWPHGRRRKI